MKYLLMILAILSLVACGASREEKETIAKVTCNIMKESMLVDAGFRLKEINAAREKMEEVPYIGSREDINKAFKYNLCVSLVSNDPSYDDLLTGKIQAEVVRKEAAKKENEEQSRIALKNWRKKIERYVGKVEYKLVGAIFHNAADFQPFGDITLTVSCQLGLRGKYEITLKDGLGTIQGGNLNGSCSSHIPGNTHQNQTIGMESSDGEIQKDAAKMLIGNAYGEWTSDILRYIESAKFLVTGVACFKGNISKLAGQGINPEEHPPLNSKKCSGNSKDFQPQLIPPLVVPISMPILSEMPDNEKLDTVYFKIPQSLVSNVKDSRMVMQITVQISTHYDHQVIDNVEKHTPALISEMLNVIREVTERDIQNADFKKNLADDLKLVMNETLEEREDFGGIENVYFTEFIIQ